MKKIKLIIADDHQIVRDGLSALFMCTEDIEVVAEVSDGNELLSAIETNETDLVMTDIDMPGKSGLDICKEITAKYENIKVIILSAYLTEMSIMEALKSGAKGILSKNSGSDDVLSSIYAVNNGYEYFSDEITKIILQSYIKKSKENKTEIKEDVELTAREKEIVILFAEGLQYKEIADKLFISVRTVESHKNNIMRKLELNSLIDLVKYAIKNKFIEL